MTDTLTITLPGKIPLTREWENMHWARRARIKKQWTMLMTEALQGHDMPRARQGERRRITVIHHRRKCDRTNLWTPTDKVLVDPLRARQVAYQKVKGKRKKIEYEGQFGLIWDDDDDHLTLDVARRPVGKGQEPRIRMIIQGDELPW